MQPIPGVGFRGLNLQVPPQFIGDNDYAVADNLWLIGGELWTRPGKQGMFAVKLGSAVWGLHVFAAADSSNPPLVTTWLVFVSSSKLYMAQAGVSTAPTELLNPGPGGGSFSISGPTVRMQMSGRYLQIVDGANQMIRLYIPYTNPTTAYSAAYTSALVAPTTAVPASLVNTIVDAANDATKWNTYPALTWPSGTVGSGVQPEMIANTANAQFSGGTGSPSPHPQGWLQGGDTMGFQAGSFTPGMECYFDAGADAEWADYDYQAPTYAAGSNTIKNARVFLASAYGHSGNGGKFQMILFPEAATVVPVTAINYTDLVIVASGATSTVTSAAHPFQAGDVNKVVTVFSGVNFTPGNYTITAVNAGTHVATLNGNVGTAGATAGVGSLSYDSGGAAADKNFVLRNPPSALPGTYQTSPVFQAMSNNSRFTFVASFSGLNSDFEYLKYRLFGASSNTQIGVNSPSLQVVDVRINVANAPGANGLKLSANNPVGKGANCLAGVWIRRDYSGAPVNLSANVISASYNAPSTTGLLPLRFGFQKAGDPITAIAWSDPVTYSADNLSFFCDVSQVDPVIRAATAYLYIQVLADLPDTIDPTNLCTISNLAVAGNLPLHTLFGGLGADVFYQYTEANCANDTTNFIDIVESDPSPISTPALQPNGIKNQGQLSLPVKANASATHYFIYRVPLLGAVGPSRLIARISLTADQAADATHTYSWKFGTRIFIDNTPESALDSAIPTYLLMGRTAAPTGATSICEWQNRLWVGGGPGRAATINGSWLLTAGNNTGLYFNTINVTDANDVAQAIKGVQLDAGGADDPIMALIPMGAYLAVWKQRSVYLIMGTDAGSFQISPHLQRAGSGLMAGLGYCVANNVALTLAVDGVRQYNGSERNDTMSRDIEPALNPKCRNGVALAPAAVRQSYMYWHDERVYLGVPSAPGDTAPTVCYIFDTRSGSWVGRWTGWNMTSAASLTGNTDTDDLYFGGQDGQIYQLTGTGDKNLSSSGSTAFAWSFASRSFGQEGTGLSYWAENLPDQVLADVTTSENASLTFTVSAQGSATTWSSPPYVINTKQFTYRANLAGSGVRGNNSQIGISGTTSTTTKITAVGLIYAEGEPGRA